jgi:hypothetical protein
MQCEISNFDTRVMFGCIQYGDLNRSINDGGSWNFIANSINERPGPWITPYHLHPRVDNILVAIYRNIWVSKNATGTANPTFSRVTTTVAGEGSAVRFSNVNDNYIFCGWKDGVLRYSSNILAAAPTFTGLPTPLNTGEITDIETSYLDVNTIYVSKGNRVFKSTNLGANWTNISGNLPNLSINCIALDKNVPEALYVGTDAGVYYKDSSMTSWILYSEGLTLNAPVRDLEIVYDGDCSANSKIFAATYGRGLWLNTVQKTSNPSLTLTSDKGSAICKGESLEITAEGADQYFNDASPDISKNGTNKFTLRPAASGQYRFYAKTSDGTCESAVFDVTVNPVPVISVSPASKTIDKGESVSMSATGADEYTWSPNSFVISGNNTNRLSVRPDNTITYTLTGKSSEGCQTTTKVTITVRGTSSILSSEKTKVEIYPNPSSEFFSVKASKKVSLRVYNLSGKSVILEPDQKYYHQLSIENIPVGIYFVEVVSGENVIETHKLKVDR